MRKLLFLAILFCAAPAWAGYDISTRNISDVDVMSVDEAVSTDYLHVYRTGTQASELLPLSSLGGAEAVTSANTIGVTECGKTFFLDSATGFASTLPSPTLGCALDFVVKTDSTGTYHTIITTGAESIKGFGVTADVNNTSDPASTAGADTISFVSATAVAGDRLNLQSDGVSWFVVAYMSTVGAVTFSSAI